MEKPFQNATGIDMKDWDLYRTCFTDELEVDFKSWTGQDAETWKADEWVQQVRRTFQGFTATQHNSTNHVISIKGDEAACVSYMQAQCYFPNDECEDTFTLGGYYANHLTRTSGGWKIRSCKLTTTWQTGDPKVFKLAVKHSQIH